MEIDREAIVQGFVAESEENLAAMESDLLQLETHPQQDDLVGGIFRCIHTLKGNALLLGFESLSHLAHEVENVLQAVRSKQLPVNSQVTSALLASVDALRGAVKAAVAGSEDVLTPNEGLRRQLATLQAPASAAKSAEANAAVTQEAAKDSSRSKTLRVTVEKLDRMLNLTGEISIARGHLRQMLGNAGQNDADAMLDAQGTLDRLCLELQETILRARMVPVGPLFRQCSRAARDLAIKLGKQVEVSISGESVEVDTSITELIRDPLIHMVRNALDHGVELPEQRRAAGKHPRGHLELKAEHVGGNIVIELRDDGRGIDVEAIRAKARAEHLLGEDEEASAQDLYRLMFQAGFSTARKVTEVSGRGVGMEVVRRNVEALRGSVQVFSKPGEGTTIRMRVPLTLAIMEGFLLGVGGEQFVVPMESAVECLDLPIDHVVGANGSAVINFRGEPLPVLRLRNVMDVPGTRGQREKVLVVREHDVLAGLVVDAFYGQWQVVIKPLGPLTPMAYGVSGSTILGDGKVGLLLDVPRLLQDAVRLTQAEKQGVAV